MAAALVQLLREYKEIFAFTVEEMPGIDPAVAVHKLNVDSAMKPVRQKKMNHGEARNLAAVAEVQKLMDAGFIRPCQYPDWVANVGLVPKPNGTWRMCVDYTNLNKACPKDSFPLPKIDRLVDSTAGHAMMSFMDAYSGFHQIPLWPEDQKKTSFVTEQGLYCYQNAELKYPTIEKFGFPLFLASKKLRPYFLAHRLIVYTDQPLKRPFTNLEASGRILNWAIELNAFDNSYEPRKAIKGKAFADFIAEMTRPLYLKNEKTQWVVHVDGSATQNGCGAGIICESPEGDVYEYAMRFNFQTSNNEAEYEALICGIQMSKAARATEVLVLSDSQLMVSQVKGEYEAKDDAMIKYLEIVHQEAQQLTSFEIQHIPRTENSKADALSKLASSASCDTPRHVFWEAKRLPKKCTWFEIWNGTLYKKAFSRPLLHCVTPEKGHEVLEDLHQGLCSSHIRGRALAEKALRTGYYWPTLKEDALDLVKRCDKCQRFAHLIRRPAHKLTPITSPIPFAKWGMDLLGPYTTVPGGLRYVIIAVDYFTKWVEAEALKNTKAQDVRAFIWKNIITRFGMPQSIIFDNGPQFKTPKLES
ncbi:uncharacterized protein [Spinacia oleracea]|uniref:Uncharacterized protein n=1 Tax=Spinacia oleracea TaxID=3562 RepID=A0A9R0JC32_SPIOL|nr:uncharacterized protein LOC110802587 [Spinacia oleracea]